MKEPTWQTFMIGLRNEGDINEGDINEGDINEESSTCHT